MSTRFVLQHKCFTTVLIKVALGLHKVTVWPSSQKHPLAIAAQTQLEVGGDGSSVQAILKHQPIDNHGGNHSISSLAQRWSFCIPAIYGGIDILRQYLWRKDIMDCTAAPDTLQETGQVSGCFGFAEGKLFVAIHNATEHTHPHTPPPPPMPPLCRLEIQSSHFYKNIFASNSLSTAGSSHTPHTAWGQPCFFPLNFLFYGSREAARANK